jgi:uncharacterized protein YndB with AHSA1/START domain
MRNAAYLAPPATHEIVLTRTFAAPRRLVFEAMTKPELLKHWFTPSGWRLVLCEVDLRVGGAWRVVLCSPEGIDMDARGIYRDIVSPVRIVDTESFDGFPGEALRTTVLVEEGGKTTLRTRIRCPHPPAPFWRNELPLKNAIHQRLVCTPHKAMPPSTRWACPVM